MPVCQRFTQSKQERDMQDSIITGMDNLTMSSLAILYILVASEAT